VKDGDENYRRRKKTSEQSKDPKRPARILGDGLRLLCNAHRMRSLSADVVGYRCMMREDECGVSCS
jgi:hypothetical protein